MKFYKIVIIAFSAFLLGACSLLGGDDKEPIAQPPPQPSTIADEFPRWSPDGETILYYNWGYRENSSGGYTQHPDSMGIWAVDITGQNNRMLFPDAHYADWNPDGKWIVFVLGAQIYKVPFDGYLADTSAVVPLATEGRNFFPEWSPNGQWITYDRSVEDDFGPSGVWIMDADGNEKQHLFGASSPSWHPDENHIIGVIGTSPTNIWKRFEVYNITNGTSEIFDAVVDNINSSPKYSPDGSKIVFDSGASAEPPQVWVMDSNGNNLLQLTEEVGIDPDWSPDGTQIVYIGPKGTPWIMNADGSDKRVVLENAF